MKTIGIKHYKVSCKSNTSYIRIIQEIIWDTYTEYYMFGNEEPFTKEEILKYYNFLDEIEL